MAGVLGGTNHKVDPSIEYRWAMLMVLVRMGLSPISSSTLGSTRGRVLGVMCGISQTSENMSSISIYFYLEIDQ